MTVKATKSGSRHAKTPIVCGADIELGNFVRGLPEKGTGAYASKLLLSEIEGYPGSRMTFFADCQCQSCRAERKTKRSGNGFPRLAQKAQIINPQDWGRKFLPANGGCAYIDMDHLELCLPEVTNAYDHVAAWHAMLRIARKAMNGANAKLPDGQSLELLVNNSDGFGHSYGSHLNFLVTRRTWDNLFKRKMQYLLWLAAFQASSIVFTGQGKVGSENGAPKVDFQIAQRADFFERLVGTQTTHHRPIVNSRDEPLCGSDVEKGRDAPARLHVIFFDNTLNHTACFLKVGVMQIVLAMIEAEQVNLELLLDDPLEAVHQWSHDPTLQTESRLAAGPSVTAVELQLLFLEEAHRFVADGGCEGIVPRTQEILELWEDTLLKLHRRDWSALERRLDWVLKRMLLERVMIARPKLNWSSPEIKHLDHSYASLDSDEGLYSQCERDNRIERIVAEDRIAYFESGPPEDTRAWTRAMLLRTVEEEAIWQVDWHEMSFAYRDQSNRQRRSKLELSHPLSLTREDTQEAFAASKTLDELLQRLGAAQSVMGKRRRLGSKPKVLGANGRINKRSIRAVAE